MDIDLVKFESRHTTTYGIKVYDEYSKGYDNLLDAKDFKKLNKDSKDLEVLEYAINSDDEQIKEMMESLKDSEHGVNVNGTWYDWDEIKELF